MIAWTWAIPVYLWLAGMAGGAYTVAFLAERLEISKDEDLLKIATWVGVPALLVGSALLTYELGQQMRFWHLFTTFFTLSPMSIGSWLLLIWPIIGIAMIALWWLEKAEGVIEVLSWINFVLAVLLIVYTGVLLSATNQPLWSGTALIPALFVVTSVSRGVAFLVAVQLVRKRRSTPTLAFLGRADVSLYILDLAVLAALLIWLGPTAKIITTGTLGLFLWVGVVLFGILIPLGVGVRAIVQGKHGGLVSLLAALWAIVGGLVLRAVIVLGGQIYG